MAENTTHCSSAASWAATLTTDEQSARRAASLFAESFATGEVAVSLIEVGPGSWRVTAYFQNRPNEVAMRALAEAAAGSRAAAALTFGEVAAKDWVGESLAGLPPVEAGRFIVHGAHDRARVPVNRIGIEIEAALAFGTGHHGTTRGCLLALDRLCKLPARPRRTLDLGTGSGVLAVAATRVLHRRVLATDIDVNAVRVARDNARLNRAGAMIEVVKANGVTVPAIRRRAPFDLVFANILLGPLQRLAAPLSKIVAPNGRIVVSGIMKMQANAALAAYYRLTLERRVTLDGWTTLVLRGAPHRRSNVARTRRRF